MTIVEGFVVGMVAGLTVGFLLLLAILMVVGVVHLLGVGSEYLLNWKLSLQMHRREREIRKR